MVTYRFRYPEPRVRVLALHLLFHLLAFLMAVAGCVCLVAAAEVDSSDYYVAVDEVSSDAPSVLAERIATGYIDSIPRNWKDFGTYAGTYLYSFWDSGGNNTEGTVKIGGYTLTPNSTILELARAVLVSHVNSTLYTDKSIAALEADIQADLTPIQSLLNTYLPRIDSNTGFLHGDLLNIQQALGWNGSGTTVLQHLNLLNSNLSLLYQTVSRDLPTLLIQVTDGFAAVTSRQDALSKLLSASGNWVINYQSGGGKSTVSVSSLADWLNYYSMGSYIEHNLDKGWGRYLGAGGSAVDMTKDVTIPILLQQGLLGLNSNLVRGMFLALGEGSYLFQDGQYRNIGSSGIWLSDIARNGFAGLSANLVGKFPDRDTTMSILRPSSDGCLTPVAVKTNNILDALGLLGTELQNPLAKLQYVWADDDDIKIADSNKPVKDEVVKDFVGDGDAAVSVGNISDIAGASSSAVSAFAGAGKVSDIFVPLNDGDSYEFWSKATADQIDTVNQPAPAAEAPLYDPTADERYVIDDDGMVHLADSAFSDVYAYLEEASK